jgi:Fanconi anemia group M protein
MGIDPSKMIELTGQIIPKKREDLWKEKRVFFLTPQVMTSDLGRGFCQADQVRCLVVDEAHKALGNHAYVEVVKLLAERTKCFRILALSATPGNDMTAVQQVSLEVK